jgi:hypothetical protein
LALTESANTNSTYFFSKQNNSNPINFLDSVAVPGEKADQRYTVVAVEKSLFGQPTTSLDHIVLRDTISSPQNSTYQRVRIIATNPDHKTISVTFGGKTVSMNVKDVTYFDVVTGGQTLQLSDGAATASIPITVSSGRPMSIYLLPKQAAGIEFPVKTIIE